MYRTVQTGPKTQGGGRRGGCFRAIYSGWTSSRAGYHFSLWELIFTDSMEHNTCDKVADTQSSTHWQKHRERRLRKHPGREGEGRNVGRHSHSVVSFPTAFVRRWLTYHLLTARRACRRTVGVGGGEGGTRWGWRTGAFKGDFPAQGNYLNGGVHLLVEHCLDDDGWADGMKKGKEAILFSSSFNNAGQGTSPTQRVVNRTCTTVD